MIKISSMKFQVQHVRGTQNVIADSLSSMFEGYQPKEEEAKTISAVLTASPLAFQDLGELQHQDTELCTIMKKLQKGEVVRNYSIEKGVLRCRSRAGREWKIVVPVAVVPMLFHYFHSAPIGGHLGTFKRIQNIRQNFIWQGMDMDIQNRVRCCKTCAVIKPARETKLGFLA